MRHLYEHYDFSQRKTYLENERNIEFLKALLSHITKILNELGFDYRSYYESSKWEVEFYDNKGLFDFYISMNMDHFKKNNIILELKKLLVHHNHIVNILPEYFNNINGINHMKYDGTNIYTYQIKIEDVGKVINQITLEDFKLKINANKYNL